MPPGESDENNDYRGFFRVIREGGYDGMVTVEANHIDLPTQGPRVFASLRLTRETMSMMSTDRNEGQDTVPR